MFKIYKEAIPTGRSKCPIGDLSLNVIPSHLKRLILKEPAPLLGHLAASEALVAVPCEGRLH